MAFADIRQAIYNWVKVESDLTVIWKDQSEARPPRPYIALKLISGPRKVGHDDLRQGIVGVEVHGQRHWTCSIDVIGAGAMDMISQLQTSLEDPEVLAGLRARGLAVIKSEDAVDLTTPLDTGFETRAKMDVLFSANVTRSQPDPTGAIENVSGTNQIDGEPFTVET